MQYQLSLDMMHRKAHAVKNEYVIIKLLTILFVVIITMYIVCPLISLDVSSSFILLYYLYHSILPLISMEQRRLDYSQLITSSLLYH